LLLIIEGSTWEKTTLPFLMIFSPNSLDNEINEEFDKWFSAINNRFGFAGNGEGVNVWLFFKLY